MRPNRFLGRLAYTLHPLPTRIEKYRTRETGQLWDRVANRGEVKEGTELMCEGQM